MKWNKESIWKDLEEGKVEVFIFIIISKIIEILKTEAKDLYFLLSTLILYFLYYVGQNSPVFFLLYKIFNSSFKLMKNDGIFERGRKRYFKLRCMFLV